MNFSTTELIIFGLFVLVNIVCAVIIFPEFKKMIDELKKNVW